jgi:hypothetical protein
VEEDHACIVRTEYDPDAKLARADVTMFRLEEGLWQRSDVTLYQRCYAEDEILAALTEAGFSAVTTQDAGKLFAMPARAGRIFFFARKEED